MSNEVFYEDLAQFMTDSMMENGFIDAKEVAIKVREHDKPSIEEHIRREFDVIQNQTVEACLEAVAELNAVIAAGGKLLLKEDVLQAIKGVGN